MQTRGTVLGRFEPLEMFGKYPVNSDIQQSEQLPYGVIVSPDREVHRIFQHQSVLLDKHQYRESRTVSGRNQERYRPVFQTIPQGLLQGNLRALVRSISYALRGLLRLPFWFEPSV